MTGGSPGWTPGPADAPIWTPDPAETAQAVITRFAQQAGQRTGRDLSRYRDLHAWSVQDLGAFWGTVADFFHLGLGGAEPLADERMPGASWFPGARLGPRVQTASTSGGTDVASGFAGSTPLTPVWPGEISAPLLGVALESWDEQGRPRTGQVGELVITRPMPSMPLYFWDDPDGQRYRDAYFAPWPGTWRHGDWAEITRHGGVIISGRSDATLNRNGVRLGSADIYTAIDTLPEISDSLVIGAELGDGDYWLVLFVVLADGAGLTAELTEKITTRIRTQASPRHVPDDVIAVPALPHTRTGKRLEVPVKRILQGHPLGAVASADAVDDLPALTQFTAYAGGPGRRPGR